MAVHSNVKEHFGLLVSGSLLLFILLNTNLLEACWLLFRLGCLLGWGFNNLIIDDLFGLGLGGLDAIFLPLELLSSIFEAHIDILILWVLLKDKLEVADGECILFSGQVRLATPVKGFDVLRLHLKSLVSVLDTFCIVLHSEIRHGAIAISCRLSWI